MIVFIYMAAALIITTLDFIINHLVFSYQRGTLYIAKQVNPGGNIKELADIQIQITPTWIGFVSYSNYAVLALAIYLLWQQSWWLVLIYLPIRLIFSAFLPTFEVSWARCIAKKYHLEYS